MVLSLLNCKLPTVNKFHITHNLACLRWSIYSLGKFFRKNLSKAVSLPEITSFSLKGAFSVRGNCVIKHLEMPKSSMQI